MDDSTFIWQKETEASSLDVMMITESTDAFVRQIPISLDVFLYQELNSAMRSLTK
jgi:hypothetical protein